VFGQFADWVYPPKCGLCGRFGPNPICGECAIEFKPLGSVGQSGPVEKIVALFRYESRAAQAARRLKYSRITTLIPPLAAMVQTGYQNFDGDEFDCTIPVPIHWRRRAMRGFNQAEALASHLPPDKFRTDLLKRVRMTKPQVGLNREERIRNLVGAFRASPSVSGMSVLLVDDVTTSGHTAEQCAIALLEAGATRVGLLALTGER
jgi:ComF family protein